MINCSYTENLNFFSRFDSLIKCFVAAITATFIIMSYSVLKDNKVVITEKPIQSSTPADLVVKSVLKLAKKIKQHDDLHTKIVVQQFICYLTIRSTIARQILG